jgi:hypothetical protein
MICLGYIDLIEISISKKLGLKDPHDQFKNHSLFFQNHPQSAGKKSLTCIKREKNPISLQYFSKKLTFKVRWIA